jgi:hypothetical protein
MDSITVLCPEQPVLHAGRRATFLQMSRGSAIIRYWGDSHAVSVPPETLSLPTTPSAARSRRPVAASDEPLARELAARDAAALQERLSP